MTPARPATVEPGTAATPRRELAEDLEADACDCNATCCPYCTAMANAGLFARPPFDGSAAKQAVPSLTNPTWPAASAVPSEPATKIRALTGAPNTPTDSGRPATGWPGCPCRRGPEVTDVRL